MPVAPSQVSFRLDCAQPCLRPASTSFLPSSTNRLQPIPIPSRLPCTTYVSHTRAYTGKDWISSSSLRPGLAAAFPSCPVRFTQLPRYRLTVDHGRPLARRIIGAGQRHAVFTLSQPPWVNRDIFIQPSKGLRHPQALHVGILWYVVLYAVRRGPPLLASSAAMLLPRSPPPSASSPYGWHPPRTTLP